VAQQLELPPVYTPHPEQQQGQGRAPIQLSVYGLSYEQRPSPVPAQMFLHHLSATYVVRQMDLGQAPQQFRILRSSPAPQLGTGLRRKALMERVLYCALRMGQAQAILAPRLLEV